MTLLHEQYEVDGDTVLFRCTECGEVYLSIGSMHAHANGHLGFLRALYHHLPIVGGPFDAAMEHTEVLRVTDTEPIDLEEVEGL